MTRTLFTLAEVVADAPAPGTTVWVIATREPAARAARAREWLVEVTTRQPRSNGGRPVDDGWLGQTDGVDAEARGRYTVRRSWWDDARGEDVIELDGFDAVERAAAAHRAIADATRTRDAAIRAAAAEGVSGYQLAKSLGVAESTVSRILARGA